MRIGSVDRGIEFGKDSIGPDCYRARLTANGLTSEALVDFDRVYANRGDIEQYLSDLAANWKGWSGTRLFETTELELIMLASRDGKGHIEFQIDLKEYPWSVRSSVSVDAGDLERLASEAKNFLCVSVRATAEA